MVNQTTEPNDAQQKMPQAYTADATKILTRREMAAVLADLRRKAPRSKNTRPEPRRVPTGRVLRPQGLRDSPPSSRGRACRNAPAAPADPRERRQGRQTTHRAALVGRGDARGSVCLASRSAWAGRFGAIAIRLFVEARPRASVFFEAHPSEKVPDGLQGAWAKTPNEPDDPPRPPHVHQPRPGRRAHARRGPRRRGALEREHYERLSPCGG